MQNTEDTEVVSVDKEEVDDNKGNIPMPPTTSLSDNMRKEIIKDIKHHTFIGYVRKVSNGNVKIALDNILKNKPILTQLFSFYTTNIPPYQLYYYHG